LSLYSEQDLYKFLERQAIALEDIETHLKKLANSPVTGFPPASTAKTPAPTASPAPKPRIVVGSQTVPLPAPEPKS